MKRTRLRPCMPLILMAALFVPPAASEGAETDDMVSINLQEADVRHVLEVMGELTGLSIIPHEKLKGRLTIISTKEIPASEVMSVLNSALSVKGFTTVRSGNVLKVVPLADAKQAGIEVREGRNAADIPEDDRIITQIIPLQYADALRVKSDLQPLIGRHANLTANENTNTIIITDTGSNIKKIATILEKIDRKTPATSQVKVYRLDYADPDDVASILNRLSRSEKISPGIMRSRGKPLEPGEPIELYGNVEAQSDARTASLIVTTSPVNFPSVDEIVRQLDRKTAQIAIHALIVEVILGKDSELGINWLGSQKYTVGDYAVGTGTHRRVASLDLGITHGLRYAIMDSGNPSATFTEVILGLIRQGKARILSRPLILTSDNKKAHMSVGTERPFLKETVVSTNTTVDDRNIYEYKDITLELSVTPHISKDGFVALEIEHKETKFVKTIEQGDVFRKTEASANIVVRSGDTVVLSGLMSKTSKVDVEKVPILGNIPVLGFFFRRKVVNEEKTELLVTITPVILSSPEDLRAFTEKRQKNIEALENDKNPVIPGK